MGFFRKKRQVFGLFFFSLNVTGPKKKKAIQRIKRWCLVENLLVIVFKIVSHSRSQDGTWLNPEKLRQILAGLEASPAGRYPPGFLQLL